MIFFSDITKDEFEHFVKQCDFNMDSKVYKGRLYKFNNNKDKKFGFIACDTMPETIFFHSNNVIHYPCTSVNLEDFIGTSLEFELKKNSKCAYNIRFENKENDFPVDLWLWLSPTDRYLTLAIMQRYKAAAAAQAICTFTVFPLLDNDITCLILKKCNWHAIQRVCKSWYSFAQQTCWMKDPVKRLRFLSETYVSKTLGPHVNLRNNIYLETLYHNKEIDTFREEVIETLQIYTGLIFKHLQKCISDFEDLGATFSKCRWHIIYTLATRTLFYSSEEHSRSFPLCIAIKLRKILKQTKNAEILGEWVAKVCPRWNFRTKQNGNYRSFINTVLYKQCAFPKEMLNKIRKFSLEGMM